MRDGTDVAGERPHRADQCRAALHVGMGDVPKIVRIDPLAIRASDGRDRHPVSAMWAGEQYMELS